MLQCFPLAGLVTLQERKLSDIISLVYIFTLIILQCIVQNKKQLQEIPRCHSAVVLKSKTRSGEYLLSTTVNIELKKSENLLWGYFAIAVAR